tara:strand:+ start:3761 stop:4039 length:279 start_codon:yes stop_codon:yes gene_type:complete
MISWTSTIGDITHLIGFDKNMKEIVSLIENENEWMIHLDNKIMKVKGNGCKDPLRFVECLVSPISESVRTGNKSIVLEFVHPDGECWEVWNN